VGELFSVINAVHRHPPIGSPIKGNFLKKEGEDKTSEVIVGFEGFTAVTVKNAVFWNVAPYGSCRS
jgi:hypothetical protein